MSSDKRPIKSKPATAELIRKLCKIAGGSSGGDDIELSTHNGVATFSVEDFREFMKEQLG